MNLSYHIKKIDETPEIEESFKVFGQIEPITIFEKNGEKYLLDGEKRVNYFENPTSISFNNIKEATIFLFQKEKKSELEALQMLSILKNENISLNDSFSIFEKFYSNISLRDFSKIYQIDFTPKIKRVILESKIGFNELKNYSILSVSNFESLFNLFSELKLNGNHRKDFFLLLDEISIRDNVFFSDIFNLTKWVEIFNSDRGLADKISQLKQLLYDIRWPKLSELTTELQQLRKKIPSVKRAIFDFPIDRESTKNSITLTFESFDEFSEQLRQLERLKDSKEFQSLLDKIANRLKN
ncbi:hypothetical protein JXR93_07175 [bacterium]|nr:hypothetical protein [bacterium]